MAKAQSPVRLQAALMRSATLSGEAQNRSAAEQIEHWATIGRALADRMTAADILEFKAGLVSVTLERTQANDIDREALLSEIRTDRECGTLKESILSGGPRYQTSKIYPGSLEQVMPDGTVTVGEFINGAFTPLKQA